MIITVRVSHSKRVQYTTDLDLVKRVQRVIVEDLSAGEPYYEFEKKRWVVDPEDKGWFLFFGEGGKSFSLSHNRNKEECFQAALQQIFDPK